jgi:branched-chain amino acid transport system ATP-binding protein
MLRVSSLSAGYGRSEVVRGVSLEVGAGECVAVIGANGAGKTTLLNAIMGLLPLQAGTVAVSGALLGPGGVSDRLRAGVALVPERRELFGSLSVADNLRLGAYARRGAGVDEDLRRIQDLFPILRERNQQRAANLSGGEQQMLAIGRALMARPRVLLLDEPSTGLAPRITLQILQTLRALRAEWKLAMLLVEQNARLALAHSSHAHVLEVGDMVMDGPSARLAGDPRVLESYLGEARTCC